VIDCLGAIFEPYRSFQRRSIEFDEIIDDLEDLPVNAILAPPPKEVNKDEHEAYVNQDCCQQETEDSVQLYLVSLLLILQHPFLDSLAPCLSSDLLFQVDLDEVFHLLLDYFNLYYTSHGAPYDLTY
jgi:hypothetical protein